MSNVDPGTHMNKHNRYNKEALKWWRSLSVPEQCDLCIHHKPDWAYWMVDTSTSTIVWIYKRVFKI